METYYLKAVVRHHEFQGIESGHYTTALNMEILWVIYDDSLDFLITDEILIDGYLFFYETSLSKLSKESNNRLSTSLIFQRENPLNFHFPQLHRGNSCFRNPHQMRSDEKSSPNKLNTPEETKESVTDMGPQ